MTLTEFIFTCDKFETEDCGSYWFIKCHRAIGDKIYSTRLRLSKQMKSEINKKDAQDYIIKAINSGLESDRNPFNQGEFISKKIN